MNFDIQQILQHPFSLGLATGLAVGLFLFFISLLSRWKKSRELRRQRKQMEKKMALETEHLELVRREKVKLEEVNENLKAKVKLMSEKPARRMAEQFEILARAEKQLLETAPSFSDVWAKAKSDAVASLQEESSGSKKPSTFLSRFLPSKAGSESVSESEPQPSPA